MILDNFTRLQKMARQAYAHEAAGNSTDYSEYVAVKTWDNQEKYVSDRAFSSNFYADNKNINGFPTVSFWIQDGIKLITQKETIGRPNYKPLMNSAELCICFGDGSTAATASDYTLSGNFIPTYPYSTAAVSQTVGSLSYVSTTVTIDTTTGARTIYHNYINNSPISVTLGEWGLFTNNFYESLNVMLTHDVLQTPITIPQGGSIRIGITLTNS